MPEISFASSIQRHVACPTVTVSGDTVRAALEAAFRQNEALRGYILDDQGHLRHHVAVFVDGEHVRDATDLGDAVAPGAKIHVIQALSGG